MDNAERADLAKCIAQTSEVLNWVITDKRSKVPAYLRGVLITAWKVRTEQRFVDLMTSIANGSLDTDLDAHGLSGPELQAKLVAFRAHYEQWVYLMDKPRRRLLRRRPAPEPMTP